MTNGLYIDRAMTFAERDSLSIKGRQPTNRHIFLILSQRPSATTQGPPL